MALLYDQETEFKTIKTILDERVPEHHRSSLLGKLKPEHFHDPSCSAAFQRLSLIAKRRFEVLTQQELVADPAIDEDLRDILRSNLRKTKRLRNKKNMQAAINVLDKYRKLRTLYEAASKVLADMEEPEVDVDAMLELMSNTVSKANSGMTDDQFYLHFGQSDTSKDVIERVLLNEKAVRIPTGFKAYDDENGGLPEKGVMIIAATTSGGKSTLAMNICAQLYEKQNRSVCRVSFEMDDLQETRRLGSHLSQIEFSKFVHGKLNMADKQVLRSRFEQFSAHGEKHGIKYTSISPTNSMTIDDVFAAVAPFGYNVIAIDYIGLLAGMDAQQQWFQLSEVTAASKRFSSKHNCLVILLAQLDDSTDKLRYARGIKEHADTMWQWNYTKPEQRDLQILPIEVSKDRDGKVFRFELSERYNVMTAEDIDGDGAASYTPPNQEDDGEPRKKRKLKKKRRLSEQSEEDEDSTESYALD